MDFALFIPILLFSIVVHEVAHAWQARREGDPTADDLGRITLNPLKHLDLFGSVILPTLLWYAGGVIFGWAKPVPVDPSRFRDPPGSDIRVSMAGIVANLMLAVLLTLVLAGLVAARGVLPAGAVEVATGAARLGIFLNLLLAIFNLIPIPPLDGSHVVANLLPARLAEGYRKIGRVGFLLILGMVFLVPGFFGALLTPIRFVMGWVDGFVRIFA